MDNEWEFIEKTPHGDKVSASVAIYRATVTSEIITADLLLNSAIVIGDIRRIALEPLPAKLAPDEWPPFKVGNDATLNALILLKMERTLSLRNKDGVHNSRELKKYRKDSFSEVDAADVTATKIFMIEVRLLEIGQVSWSYVHPAEGKFPYPPTGKHGKLEDFLTSIVRVDMLDRISLIVAPGEWE